jgi:hypothetical protein
MDVFFVILQLVLTHGIIFFLQCKPEQVQAVQEYGDDPLKVKQREQLIYRLGDVITVLDKG